MSSLTSYHTTSKYNNIAQTHRVKLPLEVDATTLKQNAIDNIFLEMSARCARKYFKTISIAAILIILSFSFYYYQFVWNGSAATVPLAANKHDAKITRVLIFSYLRSGTTFFSSLLSQHPGTFLHYEPIYLISGGRVMRNVEEERRGFSLLRHALRCDFQSVLPLVSANFTDWLTRYPMYNPNGTWLPGVYSLPPNTIMTAIEAACRQHPVQVAKIVRLPLEVVAGPLLEEFADLKVIFLARDPRPMFHSRRSLAWCKEHSSCIDPREFCAVMEKDLEYFQILRVKFPGRVKALRFEDLVLDLKARTQEVYSFLNWDYAASKVSLEEWLDSHSHATQTTLFDGDHNPYSIVRSHSESKAYEWNTTMTEEEVKSVEEFCGQVINILSSGNF